MRTLGAVILLLPLLSFIKIYEKKEALSPVNAFSAIYFLRVVIPAVMYSSTGIAESISDSYVRNAVLTDSTYLTYAVLQTISYYCVVLGIRIRLTSRKYSLRIGNSYTLASSYNSDEIKQEKYKHYLYWGIVFTIIGVIDFILIIQKTGGFAYFFSHLQYRAVILRDLDLLSWLLIFLHYGPLLIVYSMRGQNKKISIWLFVLVIIAGFMCGLGGRKTMIIMLIEMVVVYHFTVRKLTIKDVLRPRNILILLLVFVYFSVMVRLRTEGAFETFISNPFTFVNANSRRLSSILTGESYVTYYMTVIEHFKTNALWLGRSFLGLVTAFIPSSLYPAKPPVDDGMYLYSICMGRTDIIPPMATRSLNLSSYPLETFGSMYANFGMVGLIIGMILLGRIVNRSYRRIERRNYQVVDIIIYIQMLFSFELSTLRIFQVLETFIMLAVIVYFADRLKLSLGHRK